MAGADAVDMGDMKKHRPLKPAGGPVGERCEGAQRHIRQSTRFLENSDFSRTAAVNVNYLPLFCLLVGWVVVRAWSNSEPKWKEASEQRVSWVGTERRRGG